MIHIGMDVHQSSTTFCLLDSTKEKAGRFRTITRPTTAEAIGEVLAPFERQCEVVFEVGTQAQWIASIVRPLAKEVKVANPSQIPWLFRAGRKNDRLDARKLATLLYLNQLPTVHLPAADMAAFTPLFNTTGQPAISLPLHWSEAGLPVGVQLIGKPWGEAELIRLAAQLEQAMPWRDRRPALD